MSRYVPPKRQPPYGAIYTAPVPQPPDPPKEPESMPLPNDEQMVNAMRRIHIEGYMGELKRAGGIFETPDLSSEIFDPRPYADGGEVEPENRDRIDDYSLSVWTGRYVRYFTEQTDDHHERAIRAVLLDLHNSDEARQKRGEQPGPGQPPVTVTLRGPIGVSGRDFTTP
jgi:hypothetical protein